MLDLKLYNVPTYLHPFFNHQHWCATFTGAGLPSLSRGFESYPQRGVLKVVMKFGV